MYMMYDTRTITVTVCNTTMNVRYSVCNSSQIASKQHNPQESNDTIVSAITLYIQCMTITDIPQ